MFRCGLSPPSTLGMGATEHARMGNRSLSNVFSGEAEVEEGRARKFPGVRAVGPPTPAPPVLTALYPSSAKAGTSNLLVFVSGQNFVQGLTTVQFHRSSEPSPVNGPARATVVVNSQILAFQLTAADLAQAGMAMVNVVNRNSNGSVATSNQLPFAVLP